MFSKLSLSLVLTASLACVGQVTTMGGYATSAPVPVNAVDAPLVATPDIALPGSGPAVGAPLTNANDPRSATGPSIYNPNYVFPVESAQSASFSPSTPASTNQNFELGIQSFVSGAPAAAIPTQSLAEIARLIKARLPKASKAFDNESIAKLNADGVRTGNLGPESSTSASTELAKAPANNTLVAESRMPALPQSDQPATAPSRQNSATAAQQRHRDETPAETQATPASAPAAQASAPADRSENTAKLPQTSSSLPIIVLLGALGIAGGALFYLMRR